MHRVRWRWILPVFQVLLAIWLFQLGKVQEQKFYEERQPKRSHSSGAVQFDFVESPGYVPQAHQIMVAINIFPALVAAPVVSLLPEHFLPTVGRFFTLAAVFLFWWWIGWLFERRGGPPWLRSRSRIAVALFGLTISIACGGLIWHSYWGHTPFAHLVSLIWCVGFLLYSTRSLFSGLRELKLV